jgi:hypothetical protein
MKALLRKLFRFALILAIIIAGTVVLSKMTLKHGPYFKVGADTKCIVLGHSHTECGLNDKLISHTQNFSLGGEPYFYNYYKLRKLLEANPDIETVLISFSNNQIHQRMDKWVWDNEHLYKSYPKYHFMMGWDEYKILLANNPFEILKAETKSVKDFAGFMVKNRKDFLRDRNWGGYLSLERKKVDSLLKTNYVEKERREIRLELSDINIAYLRKMVDLCKEKHVRVLFLRMPSHPEWPFRKNEPQYQEIKRTKFPDVELLDFRDYPVSNDELGDFDHLNHTGAKKFSIFFNDLVEKGLLDYKSKQKDINAALENITLKDSIH